MSAPQTQPTSQLEIVFAREESPRRVFLVVALAAFLATLDMFIVNIAVPAIQRGFHGAGVEAVSWVLNGYAIVFAALLVPAGKLGDVIGRRRVFVAGLVAFGLGSVLSAAAPSLGLLIGARVLQGAGAAAVTPTSLGLLLPSVPAARRPAAIGGWAAIGAVGAASGPPLGGLLTEISWHWIFIVNVPLSLLAVIAAYRVLPEIRDRSRPPLPDGLGTVVLMAAVALATLALVKGSSWSWDGRTIGCLLAAVALAGAFVVRSQRHRAPVLELSILRVRAFALASLSATLFFASFSVMLLGNVLFLTGVWRYSVIHAGLALTPGPLAAAAFAPVSGRLAARLGPGVVGGLGAVLFTGGSVLFITLVGLHPSYAAAFLPGMLIGGAGVGLALPSFTIAATRTLKPQLLATGIGAQTMFRQIGGTLGVAAFVAILGTPSASDVLTRYDNTRWFMAASSLAAGLALALIRRPSATPAQRRAASLAAHPAAAAAAGDAGTGQR
ncbi:MAG: MFS transporter [Solirubrobacterales bacterium]|nr:MFS transporter [Solirubrobacterales bacterium]